jgi:hypothetical protein
MSDNGRDNRLIEKSPGKICRQARKYAMRYVEAPADRTLDAAPANS